MNSPFVYEGRLPVWFTPDGRKWCIDETHPQTDNFIAVCRAVEHGTLTHTSVIARSELRAYEGVP